MSDLQCPARFVLAGFDEGGVGPLVARLRGESVAHVYAGVESAASLAAARGLGVAHSVRSELARSTGEAIAPAVTAALDDLADLHRGETVLVVTGSAPTPWSVRERDADGWRVLPHLE